QRRQQARGPFRNSDHSNRRLSKGSFPRRQVCPDQRRRHQHRLDVFSRQQALVLDPSVRESSTSRLHRWKASYRLLRRGELNGGGVKIEFKSGGKAYVSTGPATNTCSYEESGKTVTLVCEGDKTVFTVDDDALNGPPGGFLTRLTKKK